MSTLTQFLDNWLTDGGEVIGLTPQPRFTPLEDFGYSFVRGSINPRAGRITQIEKKKKKSVTSSGFEPMTSHL
jgi:hypothetical protein